MSFRAQIVKGKKNRPYFLLIYGIPGIGKTTFAAQAPSPLFINLDDGLDEIREDVDEMPRPRSFTELIAQLDDILKDPEYKNKTLVVDSLTRLEALVWEEVCNEAKPAKSSITKFGYGEGYKLANVKWKLMIDKLSRIQDFKNWNIVLIAHPEVKDMIDPQQIQDYSRWQPRLHKDAMNMFIEATSAVLFAEVETFVQVNEDKKVGKALSEGVRVMKTEFRPSHVAKNRYGLPLSIALSWNAFDEAAKKGEPESAEAIENRIRGLLVSVGDENIRKAVQDELDKPEKNTKRLVVFENRLKQIVNADREVA